MKRLIILIIFFVFIGCNKSDDDKVEDVPIAPFVTKVVTVTSKTGKIWMDRNLGATQAASSTTDVAAFGDLYQWGRGADGHQLRTSSTTSTMSSSDVPGNKSFILIQVTNGTYFDWRSPQNANLWQGVNGVNNPCPPGFRIPTEAEWEEERLSWNSNNSAGAFASPLKLPAAGSRIFSDGRLGEVGTRGEYWSSTTSKAAGGSVSSINSHSKELTFINTVAGMGIGRRASGFCVRCIQN